MTEPRDTYHHGDLKRALLEASVELLREHGEAGFTLREVARRVGVNHRAAYRHFADKRAVLAEVAEQGYRELVQKMSSARASGEGDVRRELVAISLAYVEFAMAQPAHFHVMFGPRLNEDGKFPGLESEAERAFALIMETLERGVSSGVLRGALGADAAIALWSSMHGLASLVLVRRVRVKRALLRAYAERIVTPLIDGLCAR